MDRAKRKGWSPVALDFGLDTTTPAGEVVANVIQSTAQYERRLIAIAAQLEIDRLPTAQGPGTPAQFVPCESPAAARLG